MPMHRDVPLPPGAAGGSGPHDPDPRRRGRPVRARGGRRVRPVRRRRERRRVPRRVLGEPVRAQPIGKGREARGARDALVGVEGNVVEGVKVPADRGPRTRAGRTVVAGAVGCQKKKIEKKKKQVKLVNVVPPSVCRVSFSVCGMELSLCRHPF
jgi:hypothetical protein